MDTAFLNRLTLITHNVIKDKKIFEDICEKEEEIMEAVMELSRQSMDSETYYAYIRRKEQMAYVTGLEEKNVRYAAEVERLAQEKEQYAREKERYARENQILRDKLNKLLMEK